MSKWQDPVSWMMLQHDDPVLFQNNLRTNRNQSNRNPQPPFFILDTTFPQFDDLIKHSRENHPYHCYYCKTTFVLFEEVIKHSTQNHGSLMLKAKYLELNPSRWHYGYRSHNFNVIPEKIKALGQKIQTDCTSNALTIHIAKNKSTNITTISSLCIKEWKHQYQLLNLYLAMTIDR